MRGRPGDGELITAYWLYNRTGDPDLLAVAESIFKNSFDWTAISSTSPTPPSEAAAAPARPSHPRREHRMAIKHPGVWWQQSGANTSKKRCFAAWPASMNTMVRWPDALPAMNT